MIKYVFIFKLNLLNYFYLSSHLPELLKRLYLPNKRKEKKQKLRQLSGSQQWFDGWELLLIFSVDVSGLDLISVQKHFFFSLLLPQLPHRNPHWFLNAAFIHRGKSPYFPPLDWLFIWLKVVKFKNCSV